MSFAWRYAVRPDGSFCRVGNLNGRLDNVSDEELARLHTVVGDERPARPCSRCEGTLLLHWRGGPGTGVLLELCPACDGRRRAARAFIRWHRDPERDPAALPPLFEDWESETMRAHGWTRPPEPGAPPSTPVHGHG